MEVVEDHYRYSKEENCPELCDETASDDNGGEADCEEVFDVDELSNQAVKGDYIPTVHPPCACWWWSLGISLSIVVGIVVGVAIGFGAYRSTETGSHAQAPPYDGSAGDDQPPSSIETLLRAVSFAHGQEFDDPHSYQSKALQWVEAFSEIPRKDNAGLTDEKRTIQRYALACIYFSTNNIANPCTANVGNDERVRGWDDESGWMVNDDECSWRGIACSDDGFVTKINLSNNILSGSFPPEVAHIKDSLVALDLYNNSMLCNEGSNGNAFLAELINLKRLSLGRTSFKYNGIPPSLAALTNLIELDVSYSLYSGSVDGNIFANLLQLEYLDLSGLSFGTEIPTVFGSLPSLRSLYVVSSNVRGGLDFLRKGNWPAIYELWIDRNPEIGGPIPREAGRLDTLVSLSMASCNIDGQLPSDLGLLTNMQQMYFNDNSLTGTVPVELSKLQVLETLQIERNDITGSMPIEVCYNTAAALKTLKADCDDDIDCSVIEGCCSCCGEDCANVGSSND